ncbi:MAG: hypothetical protein ACI84K_001166, partial [Pseudohongiellaceae bacterium]
TAVVSGIIAPKLESVLIKTITIGGIEQGVYYRQKITTLMH